MNSHDHSFSRRKFWTVLRPSDIVCIVTSEIMIAHQEVIIEMRVRPDFVLGWEMRANEVCSQQLAPWM